MRVGLFAALTIALAAIVGADAAQEPELPMERRPNPVQATVVVKTRD